MVTESVERETELGRQLLPEAVDTSSSAAACNTIPEAVNEGFVCP